MYSRSSFNISDQMLSFIAMEEKQTGNKSNNTKNMTTNSQTETYQRLKADIIKRYQNV